MKEFIEEKIEQIAEELSEQGYGTDIEDTGEEEESMDPFNPSEISIQQRVVPMDAILRRLKQGSINLSPSFQRKFVWDETRKSRLIESIMLKIPLPMFYVSANLEGKWEVVDGLQRLSTIRDFMIGDVDNKFLTLKNLEFLGDKFNGKKFDEIEIDPREQKLINIIYETELRFTVIDPSTPEAVKRNIFKRINTGGMPLTSQEIRQALYEGASSQLLSELVSSESFRKVAGNRIDNSRLGASELVLRLLSFRILDRSSYKGNMDTWLSNAMRIMNFFPDPTEEEIFKIFSREGIQSIKVNTLQELKLKFDLAMQRSYKIFGDHSFRKSLPGDIRKSPINKSLFESWGNIFSDLSNEQFEYLNDNKELLLSNYKSLKENNDEFDSLISRHSSSYKGINVGYIIILNLVIRTLKGETINYDQEN